MKVVKVSALYACAECPIISASDGCLLMEENKCPLKEGVFIKLEDAKPKEPIVEDDDIFDDDDEATPTVCPDCGANLVLRNGPYGKFWGCSRYPQCRGVDKYRGED